MTFTVKQFLELIEYKTTEGDTYHDEALGDSLYAISYWNGLHDTGGHSFDCIYNTKTLEVVQLEAHDFSRKISYRWNPEYLRASRLDTIAYDGVDFTDLEVVEDFVEKVAAIKTGLEYDTRVSVPVDFTDAEFLKIAKAAHLQDVTVNKFIEQAIRAVLDKDAVCHA